VSRARGYNRSYLTDGQGRILDYVSILECTQGIIGAYTLVNIVLADPAGAFASLDDPARPTYTRSDRPVRRTQDSFRRVVEVVVDVHRARNEYDLAKQKQP
jgi:hypothetical protein